MAADGSVIIEIRGDAGDFTAEIKGLKSGLDSAKSSASVFGDVLKANVLSDAIVGGAKALGSAFADIGRSLLGFAKSGLDVASDLQEVQNVVDVTFGDGSGVIEDFAKSAATSFGMSELSAKQFTGTMGAMLKSMQIDDGAVLEMSTSLAGLAGDMASFYNLDPSEAFDKLRSGISGETEPLKQLGINMSVANLEAYALSQGITTAYSSMTQAEQATLRYQYLMQATADAQGDFARTSDSFANQQRILQLNMENLSASVGSALLPTVNELTTAFNNLVSGQSNVTEFVNTVSGVILGAAEQIVAGAPEMANAAMAFLQALVSGISENSTMLGTAAMEIVSVLLTGIMTALPQITTASLQLITSFAMGLGQQLPTLIPAAASMVMSIVQGIADNLPAMGTAALELVNGLVAGLSEALPIILTQGKDILNGLVNGMIEGLPEFIAQLPQIIDQFIGFMVDSQLMIRDTGMDILLNLAIGIIDAIPEMVDQLPLIIEQFASTMGQNAGKVVTSGIMLLRKLISGLISAIPELVTSIPQIIDALLEGLGAAIVGVVQIGKDIVEGLWNGISDMTDWIAGKIQGFGEDVLGGIKEFFGIASPSKIMRDEVGAMLSEGVAEGIAETSGAAVKAAEKMAKQVESAAQSNIPAFSTDSLVGRLKAAVQDEIFRFSGNLSVSSNSDSEMRRASESSRAMQAAGLFAAATAGGTSREIVMRLNGIEFGRALIPDLRAVEDQSPRIVSD